MTDAPERIWVKPFHNGAIGECWHDATTDHAKPWEFNEYIRADLHAALEAENAALQSRLAAALDLIESLVEAEKRGDARYSRNPADGEEAVVIDYDWWRAWQADAEKLVKEGGDG